MPYTRANSPFFWISWTDASGKRLYRSSGTTSKREATRLERELRAKKPKKVFGGTFDSLLLTYLEANADKPSIEREKYAGKALYSFFSGYPLGSIGASEIVEYRRFRGVSAATVIKELRVLSNAWKWAAKHEGLDLPNPVEGNYPKKPESRLRWLTRYQYKRLLVAARQSRNPYLCKIIAIAVNTGMRRGEIMGLTWDRVDLKRRVIFLRPSDAKSNRHESVPINSAVAEILADIGAGTGRVFPVLSVRKAFEAAVRRAGIGDFRFHDLRHTCASWLVQEGVPLRTVAEVLRHRDISTTMIYAHLAPDNAREAVEVLCHK